MRRHTFLWLAAALVLTSMGAAGAQEAPLFERVRNTLAEIIERRENHPLSERVRNTLAEIIERRENHPPVERVGNTLKEIIEHRKEIIERRRIAVYWGGFYCGKTFITVPTDKSLVVTIRKAHISGLLWERKYDEFELVVEPKDQTPFHVYVDGRVFLRLVTECLD